MPVDSGVGELRECLNRHRRYVVFEPELRDSAAGSLAVAFSGQGLFDSPLFTRF